MESFVERKGAWLFWGPAERFTSHSQPLMSLMDGIPAFNHGCIYI